MLQKVDAVICQLDERVGLGMPMGVFDMGKDSLSSLGFLAKSQRRKGEIGV